MWSPVLKERTGAGDPPFPLSGNSDEHQISILMVKNEAHQPTAAAKG